jgi:hypothetical protein
LFASPAVARLQRAAAPRRGLAVSCEIGADELRLDAGAPRF